MTGMWIKLLQAITQSEDRFLCCVFLPILYRSMHFKGWIALQIQLTVTFFFWGQSPFLLLISKQNADRLLEQETLKNREMALFLMPTGLDKFKIIINYSEVRA